MFVLQTSKLGSLNNPNFVADNNYVFMGFDLTDLNLHKNPMLRRVYLETLLKSDFVYLFPLMPFMTADLFKAATDQAGFLARALTGGDSSIKVFTAVSLLGAIFMLYMLGGNPASEQVLPETTKIQTNILEDIVRGKTTEFLSYYDFLKLLRIATGYKGAEILKTILFDLMNTPAHLAANLKALNNLYGFEKSQFFMFREDGLIGVRNRFTQLIKLLDRKNTIPVFVCSNNQINFQETFRNITAEDPIQQVITGLHAFATKFLPGLFVNLAIVQNILLYLQNRFQTEVTEVNDEQESVLTRTVRQYFKQFVGHIVGNTADGLQKALNFLAPLVYYLAYNIHLALPKIYSYAERNLSLNLTLTFKANSAITVYENIMVPLMYLQALTLPRKLLYNNKNQNPTILNNQDLSEKTIKILASFLNVMPTYGPSFYVSVIIPGKVFIPFGIIQEMTVSYNNTFGAFYSGQPIVVEVNLTIEDLTPIILNYLTVK